MKTALFIVNSKKDSNFNISKEVIDFLQSKDLRVILEDENLADELDLEIINEGLIPLIDFAIILGGDGTILTYLRKYGEYEIPVFSINMGRVGALAVTELDNYKEYIEKYLDNNYLIEKFLTLEGILHYDDNVEKSFVVYNDVIIHRGLSMKMLPINIAVNGSEYDRIYADGMAVATPAGSSAYNHSAGGPLLSPQCNSYVVTPICSQTKGFSSLVISKDDVLHIAVDDTFDGLTLSVDGCEQFSINKNNVRIDIKESKTCFNLIKFTKDVSLYKAVYKVIESINNIKGEK